MQLEDLTKEELIIVIKNQMFSQPSERDMLNARWQRLKNESKVMMDESVKESEKWSKNRDVESAKKWNEATELFNKAMAISDDADKIYKQMMSLPR
jgi:hypothetical protein